jgi:hypothetical protein
MANDDYGVRYTIRAGLAELPAEMVIAALVEAGYDEEVAKQMVEEEGENNGEGPHRD